MLAATVYKLQVVKTTKYVLTRQQLWSTIDYIMIELSWLDHFFSRPSQSEDGSSRLPSRNVRLLRASTQVRDRFSNRDSSRVAALVEPGFPQRDGMR